MGPASPESFVSAKHTRRVPQLFIVDPNLKSLHGHYFGYAARVGTAAAALGVAPTILASTQVALPFADPPVVPALSSDYWQEMSPSAGEDPYVHQERSAQRFASELGAALESAGATAEDAIFLPYANLVELDGVARLTARFGSSLPRLAFLFRREVDEQGIDARVGPRTVGALLRRALAMLRVHPSHEQLRVFTDSDALTDDYADRLQWRVQTAPIPVDRRFTALAERPREPKPVVIGYFGDARTEKGYQRLPPIATLLKPALERGDVRMVLQSNFNLPGGEPGIPAARQLLAAFPGVDLLSEPLADDEYCRQLGATHIVLLPYEADRYVARTSGILAEAIHAGVPLVVPDGTWMSEQLRRHGAGVVYDPWQPDGLDRAVERAMDRLPDLLSRAQERRPAFIAFHNPDRLARFVCGATMLERAAGVRAEGAQAADGTRLAPLTRKGWFAPATEAGVAIP
jgi:glycosyltransferase involved in cell wall biosynthesis